MDTAASAAQLPGHLAENVMYFARVLRTAGLPVGTDRVQLTLQALQVAGLESRIDFKATLAACMIDRHEHRALFEQAFYIFWRDPDLLGRIMAMMLPRAQAKPGAPPPPENRRLAAALFPNPPALSRQQEEERIEIEAPLTWSEREVLRTRDFETMTPEEWTRAKQAIAQLRGFFERLPTRRMTASHQAGRADWRASLRAMARQGGELWEMRRRRPREVAAPLVVLADISGSMSRYSRMLLHFTHALAGSRAAPKVESFVFGTRLTPITRLLRQRDPDLAVGAVARRVQDWSGGTRISACLHDFNRLWARRVLRSNATVLLITDGLEQGSPDDPQCQALSQEMERLAKSCRRLVWLNPLLRYDAFEPKAAGIRAMLPHVQAFVPAHNLASLEALAQALTNKGNGFTCN